MNNKILGCLLGAASGDALGTASDALSPRQIQSIYGGRINDFIKPAPGLVAYGREAGQISDKAGIPLMMIDEILSAGKVDRDTAASALLKWGNCSMYDRFTTMTNRNIIDAMKSSGMSEWNFMGNLGNKLFKSHYYALSDNGGACRAWIVPLFVRTEIDQALDATVEMTLASHEDAISISGACAVSAAVFTALYDKPSVNAVIASARYGAERGLELAQKRADVLQYPGPSVNKRLEDAIRLTIRALSPENIVTQLGECIGSGPAVAETVPTVFGILSAYEGHPFDAVLAAANIGDQCSAIASLTGAICGAMYGAEIFPEKYLTIVNEANGYDLQETAKRIAGAAI